MLTDSSRFGITRRQLLLGSVAAAAGFCFNRPMNAATSLNAVLDFSLTQLVMAIKSGELRAGEYVEALLAHGQANAHLNAFINQDPAGLQTSAAAIDVQVSAGGDPGPLTGAPLAIKDNIDVLGYATTAGTPALKDWRPSANAPVAAHRFPQ